MTGKAVSGNSVGGTLAVNRRHILAGGALATAALPVIAAAPTKGQEGDSVQELMRDAEHYVSLGNKRSGGLGDMATGEWLESELQKLGFRCTRHPIDVPWFEAEAAHLSIGEDQIPVLPLGIPMQTPPQGLTGGLLLPGGPATIPGASAPLIDTEGSIALAFLPYARWSSALTPVVGETVAACRRAGACAVLLVTTGPTGKAIMLNADGAKPMFDIPVAAIAPEDAMKIVTRQGEQARLVLHGSGGRRPAFNLVAQRGRTDAPQVIISSPRSGWFTCGAERGPGVAVWLDLARHIAHDNRLDVTFLSTSGHEYENLGAEHVIDQAMPAPDRTRLWLHLGAGFAARDWHEFGTKLAPLPGVDAQRFLSVSDSLLTRCRTLFAGQPGLEAPYATSVLLGGELKTIAARGYRTIVGLFGAHRFHHVESDGVNCIHPEAMARAVQSLRQLIADFADQ